MDKAVGRRVTNAAWRRIWRSKSAAGTTLDHLLAASGYDSPFCHIDPAAWREYVLEIRTRMGMRPGESVLEVGCGAGAFLLPLYEAGHPVAGIDLGPGLVEAASKAMPDGAFHVGEATAVGDLRADHVVSHGTFLYFPDRPYAEAVLAAMWRAARRGVAALDVPDEALRSAAIAERRRIAGPEYDVKYQDLPHQFFPRSWFVERLPGARTSTFDQFLPGYANAPFRFHFLAWKNGKDDAARAPPL